VGSGASEILLQSCYQMRDALGSLCYSELFWEVVVLLRPVIVQHLKMDVLITVL